MHSCIYIDIGVHTCVRASEELSLGCSVSHSRWWHLDSNAASTLIFTAIYVYTNTHTTLHRVGMCVHILSHLHTPSTNKLID